MPRNKEHEAAVREAIPFDCDIQYGHQILKGRVMGRKLDFPVVVPDDRSRAKFEVSWTLAYGMLTRHSPVRY